MIVTIIQFDLEESIDSAEAYRLFSNSVDKFVDMPGLSRKYYMLSEDASSSTSVYLWETRDFAESLFTEEWKVFIQEKYGYRPTVTYFDCPLVIDNVVHEVVHAKN